MEKEKEDGTMDINIDNIIDDIQYIRLKDSQLAYQITKTPNPILESCRINLIDECLTVVSSIKKDKKTLGQKEFKKKRKEYIKKLLTPLIKLNKLQPLGEEPYKGGYSPAYQFTPEHIWINREIDLDNLKYDKGKYELPPI